MTDQEIICTFMEPKPRLLTRGHFKWWPWLGTILPERKPRTLTLDALHEVEARLSGEQWRKYIDTVVPVRGNIYEECKALIHADAPTKIAALAAVLRPGVEVAP